MTRTLLYEAARVLLTRVTKWSWLKAWAMNGAERRGRHRAIVALARRLAVIMHRLWSDGTQFRWTRKEITPVAVTLRHDPRMEIVDADDLPLHGHQGEISFVEGNTAMEAASRVCGTVS